MNCIETTELTKIYNGKACVKQLSLAVPQGAVYGFLGPNGAGKSTTLKMLLGLAKPQEGSVCLFGETLTPKNRLEMLRRVGSLIESPSYYGHLTGEENLKIVQTLRQIPEKRIDEVLRVVRLDNQQKKKVSAYSLGMKQRLGLAMALLSKPELLILDEPTNGLDPSGIQEMRALIKELPKRFGMTVVVSSHLLSEVDQIATHVGIIREGELVFQDTLKKLHARSSHQIALRTLNNDEAKSLLETLGVKVTVEGAYLYIQKLGDAQIAECVRRLVAENLNPVRIEERSKSLEAIFLELTGKAVSL